MMVPKYSHKTFTEVWDEYSKFETDYKESPFYNTAFNQGFSDDSLALTFYLLYNKYGNNPIANDDENQFKFKVFGLIFQYGPTWQHKLKIQQKLRDLGLEDTSDIFKGSKAIYNHAFNPETAPKTSDLEEINYINDQNTTAYKKSKIEGFMALLEVLKDDVSSTYIDKFRKLFQFAVLPIPHAIYTTEEDED